MEPEIEKFEITDYDLENEFNPNRKYHRLTKNQQIYGIWAQEEDSDNDERPTTSRASKGRKKDYTSGISFVGGGIQKDGKPQQEKKKESDEDNFTSSDEEEFSRKMTKNQQKGKIYQRFENVMKIRQSNQSGIGDWEINTKGIGKKLLAKMGYQPGKGLGKNLQGIVTPITATVRKGRGAVGAYGPERKDKKSVPVLVDSEGEEEEKDLKQKLRQWKKEPQSGSSKVIYVYKTVDEVISEGGTKKIPGDQSNLSKVKVIDMTGPEQKVFSGYHALSNQHSKPLDVDEDRNKKFQNFALPELLHNMDLLVEMTEQHIIKNDRELRHEKDKITNIAYEEERLTAIVEHEKAQINKLENLESIIASLTENKVPGTQDPLTLEDLATVFYDLQENYYEEYKMYELAFLAVNIVQPLLRNLFEGWRPLAERKRGMDSMKIWKDILEDENRVLSSHSASDMDPYHQLLWDIWMPFVRNAVKDWNCRDSVPLIELIENWLPLLPTWITENILDQLVMPRLQIEVDGWNPLTDRVPIHAWIHPWLPLLGSRLELLFPTIRYKLANALISWHPKDHSAKIILQPWKDVFSRGTMEAFLIKNILPKLALCLQKEFTINPPQQILDPWYWVMAWEDMLPLQSLISLLEKHFFPKWLEVLCAWLGHNPNYDEITQWYTGWKSMFSSQFLNHPAIKEQFKRALDVMNRAVTYPQRGCYPLTAQDHMAYLTGLDRRDEMAAQAKREYDALSQAVHSAGSIHLGFKDLIERKALENGLVYVPVPNRFYEAKQVYRFGNLFIYIDKGVVFVQKDQIWIPCSPQALVEMAM